MTTARFEELWEQLADDEDRPAMETVRAIHALGEEAVAPLMEVVRRANQDPDDYDYADIAIGLLGALKAQAAVPLLLEAIVKSNVEDQTWLPVALREMGAMPIAELEELARDEKLEPSRRMSALEALEGVASVEGSPKSFSAIGIPLLTEWTRRSEELSASDCDIAAFLVCQLAEANCVDARDAIEAAFTAGIVPAYFVDRETVERYFEEAESDELATRLGFLELYEDDDLRPERDEWDEDFEEELDSEPYHRGSLIELPEESWSEPEPSEPLRVVKVGRNEPCPCGSGKKHKKCCGTKGQ